MATTISRLLGDPHHEVRNLGELLKQAAREPAFNVGDVRMKAVLEKIRVADPGLADEVAPELLREVRVSPTLVKYANANVYEIETRRELRQAAAELMKDAQIAEQTHPVQLLDDDP